MDEKAIHYSRVIAVMAQQDALEADAAITFCKVFLPQMLAELDVLNRMVQQRAESWAHVPAPVEPPTPEPAAPKPKPKAKKQKKATTPPKPARRKHGRRRP